MSLALKEKSSGHWELCGEVDVDTITQIIIPGYQMIDATPAGQNLKIDLAGVTKADSASVALLLDWIRHAQKHGKTLYFSNLPAKMKDIMKVSNLGSLDISTLSATSH